MPEEEQEVLETEDNSMEEFPVIDNKPEYQNPVTNDYLPKKESHKLRNWIIGLSIVAGLGIAGDAYLQGSKIKVINYNASKGYVQLYDKTKVEASEYYKANLEEKVEHAKNVMQYHENKGFYHTGLGAAGAFLAVTLYQLLRGKKKPKE